MEDIAPDCLRCKKLVEWMWRYMDGQSWCDAFRCPHRWDNIVEMPDDEQLETYMRNHIVIDPVEKVRQCYFSNPDPDPNPV